MDNSYNHESQIDTQSSLIRIVVEHGWKCQYWMKKIFTRGGCWKWKLINPAVLAVMKAATIGKLGKSGINKIEWERLEPVHSHRMKVIARKGSQIIRSKRSKNIDLRIEHIRIVKEMGSGSAALRLLSRKEHFNEDLPLLQSFWQTEYKNAAYRTKKEGKASPAISSAKGIKAPWHHLP